MPYLTQPFGLEGALIDLTVGPSLPRQQALKKAGQPVPPPVRVRGLIDTGASLTAIDPGVLQALSLTPTGTVGVVTPTTGTTPQQLNQYDVQIIILHPALTYSFHVLPVIESVLGCQGFDVLIGRDMLAECLFVYDGRSGLFTLAF